MSPEDKLIEQPCVDLHIIRGQVIMGVEWGWGVIDGIALIVLLDLHVTRR